MEGFHLGLGLSAGLLVVVAVNLAMIIPSGPAGLGVFEAATLAVLLPYHVDRPTALSYALLLHALNLIPFIVFGYIALQYHAIGGRWARRAGSESPSAPTEQAAAPD
jgi:uncharacterized membrane protein YbhN (UPF0104 family)